MPKKNKTKPKVKKKVSKKAKPRIKKKVLKKTISKVKDNLNFDKSKKISPEITTLIKKQDESQKKLNSLFFTTQE